MNEKISTFQAKYGLFTINSVFLSERDSDHVTVGVA